jgi:hypothetical protein
MKQKCEEIIIDQYLKGNISNEFKNNILAGFKLIKENNPVLKELLMELQNNPIEALKYGEKMFKDIGDNYKEAILKHNPKPSHEELSLLLNELIKEDEEENKDLGESE